eukprot:m.231418 g.231418  ORF g.231418 m.231418 type:complete len:523 (-) comp18356_c0_seq1:24-1592(-)
MCEFSLLFFIKLGQSLFRASSLGATRFLPSTLFTNNIHFVLLLLGFSLVFPAVVVCALLFQVFVTLLVLAREWKSRSLALALSAAALLFTMHPFTLSHVQPLPAFSLALTSASNSPFLFLLWTGLSLMGLSLSVRVAHLLIQNINYQDVLFRVFGLFTGVPVVRVRDPALSHQILKAYDHKGDGLERRAALPAWSPVRSLESVDGEEWQQMHTNFMKLTRLLPGPTALRAITHARLEELLEGSTTLDSLAISRFTLAVFLEYLFGAPSAASSAAASGDLKVGDGGVHESKSDSELNDPVDAPPASPNMTPSHEIIINTSSFTQADLDILVNASVEWRRAIALRGPASEQAKADAVNVVLSLIRRSSLWELFGEQWAEPAYYSLILQPFLISPAINVADVMVTVSNLTKEERSSFDVKQIIALAHPFPILERRIADDRFSTQGLPRGTHVIIFTSDLQVPSVFGAGRRVCAGADLALSLLEPLVAAPPELYSGRDNDSNLSLAEMWYLGRAVWRAICMPAARW